ncbi:hypothetical protein SCALM49S_01125 [Streptomyces californicus]
MKRAGAANAARRVAQAEANARATISPYLTEHIHRFGEYPTHELGIQPDATQNSMSTSPRYASRT